MNDEIIEEVHRIRECLYEETKMLTPDERRQKAHAASSWVQERIAEYRTRKNSEQSSERHSTIGK